MTEKINILEICNGLWIWWTEKTMQIFCKYLDISKFNVYCVWLFRWWEREFEIKKYVRELCIANWDIQKVKQLVINHSIDIVHWHSITVNPGSDYEKSLELLQFLKSHWIRIIETSPFSLYDKEIDSLLDMKLFVSGTNLVKYFWKFGEKIENRDKYHYLYNPLDIKELEKFRLNQQQKWELREKYGIAKEAFVIWKVWRANLWKWDDAIIDVVPILIKSIPNLRVVIRAIPEIKKRKVRKLWVEQYFLYLPESVSEEDITGTYQLMDVMLHTSRIGESFGIAIVEGMYFWLPVITCPTDYHVWTIFDRDNAQCEVVIDNVTGYIESRFLDICARIVLLAEQPEIREQLSENAIRHTQASFDAQKLTLMLEKFLEKSSWKKLAYMDNQATLLSIKKESLSKIFVENFKAIRDKFIFKA